MVRRRLGLQGLLIATLIGVGFLASMAVLLSVLPTFEQTVRRDRGDDIAAEIKAEVTARLTTRTTFPIPLDPDAVAQALATRFAGQARLLRSDGNGYTVIGRSEVCCGYLDSFPAPAPETLSGAHVVRAGSGIRVDMPFATSSDVMPASYQSVMVQVAAPVPGGGAELAVVRTRLTIAVAVVFGLAALSGYALARVFGRRISRLARTAASIASGDLTARAPLDGPQELATLGDGLNTMAARIQAQVGQITGERDRARVLISSLAEGVVAVGDDDRIGMVNPAALRLMGFPQGARLTRLSDLPTPIVAALEDASAEPADVVGSDVVLADGTELNVAAARLTPPAAGMVVTLRDITEMRRLERARRDLVANVSHELKTPLAAIKGLLELLEGDRLDPEHRREFLGLMSTEADRLERLVEEQLQLARLDSGGLPLELSGFDLDALAEGVVASRTPLAAADGIALTVHAPPSPVPVWADPARVEQVLLILLDNAVRHTPRGGTIEVLVETEPGVALLRVRDTGEGIPVDEQPFVFDRFYRGDRSREGRSAGLGLAIARGLAVAHGGSMEVRSVPGVGSTFTLVLPSRPSPTAEHPMVRDPSAPVA